MTDLDALSIATHGLVYSGQAQNGHIACQGFWGAVFADDFPIAPNKTALFNQALVFLGTSRVSSATDKVAEAEALAAVCDEVRHYLLDQYPWTFARKVVPLVRLVDTPGEVWNYFYQLPSDMIRPIRISDGDDNDEWQVGVSVPHDIQADDRLATDAEEPFLFYIFDEINPIKWSHGFRTAMAWRLAYEVAEFLTEDLEKQDMAEAEYLKAIEIAKSQDSIGSRVRPENATSWVRSRGRRRDRWWH